MALVKYIIATAVILIISFLLISKPYSYYKEYQSYKDSLDVLKQQKRDTIFQIDTFILHTETSIQPILNKIKRLENSLNNIDEKLKKDTNIINNFSINQLDSALRARYDY